MNEDGLKTLDVLKNIDLDIAIGYCTPDYFENYTWNKRTLRLIEIYSLIKHDNITEENYYTIFSEVEGILGVSTLSSSKDYQNRYNDCKILQKLLLEKRK